MRNRNTLSDEEQWDTRALAKHVAPVPEQCQGHPLRVSEKFSCGPWAARTVIVVYDRAMEQDNDDKFTASELPTMMTVPEVIELLRLSRGSVYQCLKTGEIPGARTVGRTIRVHRPTLEKWLESGQLPPRSRARSRGRR